jgi:LPXTG-motif cell wall-anchored protein
MTVHGHGPASGTGQQRRRQGLMRMAVVSAVLTVLLAADATYMSVSGYGSDSTNNFHMSDAATVFVAAGILLLVTAALLLLRRRASDRGHG